MVASDEVVDGPVVSFDGPVTVNGTVDGNIFVADGRVVVRGGSPAASSSCTATC